MGEEERRKVKMRQNFARSMSVEDALEETMLLCYEMNGEPLPHANGAPLRLIAPRLVWHRMRQMAQTH